MKAVADKDLPVVWSRAMARKYQILICDDDQSFALAIKQCLRGEYECRLARNTDEALVILRGHTVDIVLLDIQMRSDTEGLDAIPKLLEIDPELMIIMSSGRTDISALQEAMRRGAADYIPKQSDPSELKHAVDRAASRLRLTRDRAQQDFETRATHQRHPMIGVSRPIQELSRLLDKVRDSDLNVVITGETGTGKELVARQLRSTRPDGTLSPFVSIDASTIQSTLAESILFGYERGAFTGAEKATKGIFEEAQDGTVYFDEIANMPLDIQPKLLRVLQEKEITRLGSSRAIPLQFRVIAATNQNLAQRVSQGLFKEDLWQRLNVVPIELPPLRKRPEDIPLLIEHFCSRYPRRDGTRLQFHPDAIALLMSCDWPGNVRELGNVVAYLSATHDTGDVDIPDLPPHVRDAARSDKTRTSVSFYSRVGLFEKELLQSELERCEGNISKLALALEMDRSHLYTKLREHGLRVSKSSRGNREDQAK